MTKNYKYQKLKDVKQNVTRSSILRKVLKREQVSRIRVYPNFHKSFKPKRAYFSSYYREFIVLFFQI